MTTHVVTSMDSTGQIVRCGCSEEFSASTAIEAVQMFARHYRDASAAEALANALSNARETLAADLAFDIDVTEATLDALNDDAAETINHGTSSWTEGYGMGRASAIRTALKLVRTIKEKHFV